MAVDIVALGKLFNLDQHGQQLDDDEVDTLNRGINAHVSNSLMQALHGHH